MVKLDPLSLLLGAAVGVTSVLKFGTVRVDHPALLNTFNPVPNAVRFAIVFDGTVDGANNDLPGLLLQNIKGVTDVRIRVLPD